MIADFASHVREANAKDAALDLLRSSFEETRQMVSATMSQLPEKYRAALEAKYLKGNSVRDIAATTGQSEKAMESLLTRAREAFRETFLSLTRNLSLDLER